MKRFNPDVWQWRTSWFIVWWSLLWVWTYDDLNWFVLHHLVSLTIAAWCLRRAGRRIPAEIPADDRIKS